MAIQNALASVAVKNLDRAAHWYAQLLGVEGKRPMQEVSEWIFPYGGGLQVYLGAERAGSCSFTLTVTDIEEGIRKLENLNVDTSNRTSSERVKTLMILDPDGNSIALAQVLDDTLAH